MTNKNMKKVCIYSLLTLIACTGLNAIAAQITNTDPSVPKVQIDKNGNALVEGLKVVQIANTSFFARTDWEKSFIRWIIKTDTKTQFRKHYGDPMTVRDIKEGDYLTAEGYIEGGNSLAIVATTITDWSDYTAQSKFAGIVKSIEAPSKKFILTKDTGGDITVFLNATTTVIRNKREILPSYLRVGDKITSITGTYNTVSYQMIAERINIYINPNIFAEQNYQGTLKSLPTDTPSTFTLTVGNKDYKVIVDDGASILNNKRQSVTFVRFLLGDIVRIWGYIRADNDEMDTIHASIVRNLNF